MERKKIFFVSKISVSFFSVRNAHSPLGNLVTTPEIRRMLFMSKKSFNIYRKSKYDILDHSCVTFATLLLFGIIPTPLELQMISFFIIIIIIILLFKKSKQIQKQ
jgi:hypothetical protein